MLTMRGVRYGAADSIEFTARGTKRRALENWRAALDRAREKGPAPALAETIELTPRHLQQSPALVRDGHKAGDRLPARALHARYSQHRQRLATLDAYLVGQLAAGGARPTPAASLAPPGTTAAAGGHNDSNRI